MPVILPGVDLVLRHCLLADPVSWMVAAATRARASPPATWFLLLTWEVPVLWDIAGSWVLFSPRLPSCLPLQSPASPLSLPPLPAVTHGWEVVPSSPRWRWARIPTVAGALPFSGVLPACLPTCLLLPCLLEEDRDGGDAVPAPPFTCLTCSPGWVVAFCIPAASPTCLLCLRYLPPPGTAILRACGWNVAVGACRRGVPACLTPACLPGLLPPALRLACHLAPHHACCRSAAAPLCACVHWNLWEHHCLSAWSGARHCCLASPPQPFHRWTLDTRLLPFSTLLGWPLYRSSCLACCRTARWRSKPALSVLPPHHYRTLTCLFLPGWNSRVGEHCLCLTFCRSVELPFPHRDTSHHCCVSGVHLTTAFCLLGPGIWNSVMGDSARATGCRCFFCHHCTVRPLHLPTSCLPQVSPGVSAPSRLPAFLLLTSVHLEHASLGLHSSRACCCMHCSACLEHLLVGGAFSHYLGASLGVSLPLPWATAFLWRKSFCLPGPPPATIGGWVMPATARYLGRWGGSPLEVPHRQTLLLTLLPASHYTHHHYTTAPAYTLLNMHCTAALP